MTKEIRHYDGLGSVVNLTSSTGVTQWTYAYLPYGGVRTETKNQNQAPANVLRFTGQVLDPTGLYQLRARSYDPATGRFISTDPAAAGPTDPYVSAYAYVSGNPVRYTDPSGRESQAAIASGVGGYLAANTAVKVVDNFANKRPILDDPLRGVTPQDVVLSGAAGLVGGPIGSIGFRATRVVAGALAGCAFTFASQAVGGRAADYLETGIGCASGGVGSYPQLRKFAGFVFGAIVAGAQSLATYVEQRLQVANPPPAYTQQRLQAGK